jgi:hypothetical protein
MQSGSSAYVLARIPQKKLRNPHPTSVLAQLSDERKAQLHEWLKSLMPYKQIVERMAKEWNIRTWTNSLSTYYHNTFAHEILEQRDKIAGVTETLNKAITRKPEDYAKAIVDSLGGKSVELSNNPEAHPKVIKVWVDMFCKLEELQLRKRIIKVKERRVRILEKQAAEARETAQDSKLTAEEQAERIREIFKPRLDEPDEAQTNGNGIKDGIERATHD